MCSYHCPHRRKCGEEGACERVLQPTKGLLLMGRYFEISKKKTVDNLEKKDNTSPGGKVHFQTGQLPNKSQWRCPRAVYSS